MLDSSRLFTMAFLVNLLFCLVVFFVRMWFLNACLRLILPVPVTLNLFLAPDLVFTFGILFTRYSLKISYLPALPLGAIIKYILFPSNLGIDSTFPHSSNAVANFSNKISPLSLYTIERPAKCTYDFTFAPSFKKFSACFTLKLKSWSSVLGPKRIYFKMVFWACAFISFCFFFCSYLNLL